MFQLILLARDGQGMQMGELGLLLPYNLMILVSDVWVVQKLYFDLPVEQSKIQQYKVLLGCKWTPKTSVVY